MKGYSIIDPFQEEVVEKARYWLGWYDEQMQCLLEDPMTSAMGAPVEDFAEDWSKRQKRELARLLPSLPEGDVKDQVLDYFDRWMP